MKRVLLALCVMILFGCTSCDLDFAQDVVGKWEYISSNDHLSLYNEFRVLKLAINSVDYILSNNNGDYPSFSGSVIAKDDGSLESEIDGKKYKVLMTEEEPYRIVAFEFEGIQMAKFRKKMDEKK